MSRSSSDLSSCHYLVGGVSVSHYFVAVVIAQRALGKVDERLERKADGTMEEPFNGPVNSCPCLPVDPSCSRGVHHVDGHRVWSGFHG